MNGGYFTLGRVHGIPIRLHWSLPIGSLFASGGRFAPGIWLGYLLVVLIHEAGHAFLVRRARLRVLSIDVHALGGLCRWQGQATPRDVSVIAWGGVLAQAALLAATFVLTSVIPMPGAFGAQLAEVLTVTNLFIMVLNLVPVRPFDGAEAWRIFRYVRAPRPPPSAPIVQREIPKVRVVERPVVPGEDIRAEMERIVREATLARRGARGRDEPN